MKEFLKSLLKHVLWVFTMVFALDSNGVEPSKPWDWEESLVILKVNRKDYSVYQPWNARIQSNDKMGVVVSSHEILTTSDDLQNHTLVRAQKNGQEGKDRGKWWNAKVKWVDYHANLALMEVEDPDFWNGLVPAPFADTIPTKGTVGIKKWKEGILESWKAEITKLSVGRSQISFVEYMTMKVTSDIPGSGFSEAVVSDEKVIGVVSSEGSVIPSPWIQSILKARENGSYSGLSGFGFQWQKAENPDTLKFLKWKGKPQGTIVTHVMVSCPEAQVFRLYDLILEIDGFQIDIQGNYLDPKYGYLNLENLATRNQWAGNQIRFKVWRNEKIQEIHYTLPRADGIGLLVPPSLKDQEPEYLVSGGLVFQPLTESYLKSWGNGWRQNSPFRLFYYGYEESTQEQPSLVILSQVLPDVYNLGYQDYRFLIVDKINGKKIHRIEDIQKAFGSSKNGFHTVEFAPGRNIQRLVLNAIDLEAATQRILKNFGIQKDHVFQSDGNAK